MDHTLAHYITLPSQGKVKGRPLFYFGFYPHPAAVALNNAMSCS